MRQLKKHETAKGQASLFGDIEVHPAKHCHGCKRTISQEQSVKRGYGPACWIKKLEKMIREGDTPAIGVPLPLPPRQTK